VDEIDEDAMIPMPGTPAFSWRMLCARVQGKFEGADFKVCVAFWLFGKSTIIYVL
jgi:battenin